MTSDLHFFFLTDYTVVPPMKKENDWDTGNEFRLLCKSILMPAPSSTHLRSIVIRIGRKSLLSLEHFFGINNALSNERKDASPQTRLVNGNESALH